MRKSSKQNYYYTTDGNYLNLNIEDFKVIFNLKGSKKSNITTEKASELYKKKIQDKSSEFYIKNNIINVNYDETIRELKRKNLIEETEDNNHINSEYAKWVPYGKWSKCNKKCGGGIQSKNMICKRGDELVDEKECNNFKPIFSKECNVEICEEEIYKSKPNWESEGEWSACDKKCGGGIQKKKTVCKKNNKIIDDENCKDFKPSYIRECNKQLCSDISINNNSPPLSTYNYESNENNNESYEYIESDDSNLITRIPRVWSMGDWSECSKSCGGGKKKRNVKCKKLRKIVSDDECKNEKPNEIEDCNKEKCILTVDEKINCRKKCFTSDGINISKDGTGKDYCLGRSFNDKCINEENYQEGIDCHKCSGMPDPEIPYDWVVGDWGSCNKNCGDGIQERNVFCKRGDNNENEIYCLKNKPITEKNCKIKDCPKWIPDENWSNCSVECGGGEKIKNVLCKDGENIVDDSNCKEQKPIYIEACNNFKCCPTNDNQKDVGCPVNAPYRSNIVDHQTASDGKGIYCYNHKSCADSMSCWQKMTDDNGSDYCKYESWSEPLICPINDNQKDEGCPDSAPYRSKVTEHQTASDGKGAFCFKNKSCAESGDCWQKMTDENVSDYCDMESWVQPSTCPINDNQKDEGCPDSAPYRSKIASHQTASDGKGLYCYNYKSCAESMSCWEKMQNENGSGYCQDQLWVQPSTCPINDNQKDEGCPDSAPYRSKIASHQIASDGKGLYCYNHKSCAESIDCWQKMKDEHGSGYCQDQSWVQPATCPINDNQKDVGCPDSSPYRSKWASHQTESDGKGKYCFNNKSCAESTDCWQEMSANNGSNYCQNEFWVNPLNAEKCPESDYPYRTRQRGHKGANYKYCYKTKNFALGIDTGGSTVWTDDYAAPNNYNPTWPCVCENDASGRNCNNSSGYSSTSSNWCYVSGSCENARIPYTNDEDGREGVVISGSKPWTYCSYMNPS